MITTTCPRALEQFSPRYWNFPDFPFFLLPIPQKKKSQQPAARVSCSTFSLFFFSPLLCAWMNGQFFFTRSSSFFPNGFPSLSRKEEVLLLLFSSSSPLQQREEKMPRQEKPAEKGLVVLLFQPHSLTLTGISGRSLYFQRRKMVWVQLYRDYFFFFFLPFSSLCLLDNSDAKK